MSWWKDLRARHQQVEERIERSTQAMRDVSDVVLALKASTDRLETVLTEMQRDIAVLREENNNGGNGDRPG